MTEKRTLLVEIVTPEEVVYAREVHMVVAPAVNGEVGILPLHIPMVAQLGMGEVRTKIDERYEYFAVDGGFLEVREDKVAILAEHAVPASQIDVDAVQRTKEDAERNIAGASEEEIDELRQALARAVLMLKVARKARGG